ncbi:hypothetical protein B0H11DRAFT_2258611 [Mycena galericulata]|nr:hypothetical protein B0H11DRAFT_2258611 [Mycena galericulata]
MLVLSLLALLSLALAAHVYPTKSAGRCPGATVLSNSIIQVGPAQVHMSSFSCPPKAESAPRPPRTLTPGNNLAARQNDSVCGDVYSFTACFGTGDVPAASDCAVIADAIDILSAELGPTYELNATNGYHKELTFGTCLTFIEVPADLDRVACWSDWSRIITQLLAVCPGSPIGECQAIVPGIFSQAFLLDVSGLETSP